MKYIANHINAVVAYENSPKCPQMASNTQNTYKSEYSPDIILISIQGDCSNHLHNCIMSGSPWNVLNTIGHLRLVVSNAPQE